MKTSSSKPAIFTYPDNQCSLHSIKYCLEMYFKCLVGVFNFFWGNLFTTVPQLLAFLQKRTSLSLSEAIVSFQKPPSPYNSIGKQYLCAFQATSRYQIILAYNVQLLFFQNPPSPLELFVNVLNLIDDLIFR